MVSPIPVEQKEVVRVKTKKPRRYQGETVADRLLASAKRMEEQRIAEEKAKKEAKTTEHVEVKKEETTKNETTSTTSDKKLTLQEKLGIATSEIDDLSILEWETSSERSGP